MTPLPASFRQGTPVGRGCLKQVVLFEVEPLHYSQIKHVSQDSTFSSFLLSRTSVPEEEVSAMLSSRHQIELWKAK